MSNTNEFAFTKTEKVAIAAIRKEQVEQQSELMEVIQEAMNRTGFPLTDTTKTEVDFEKCILTFTQHDPEPEELTVIPGPGTQELYNDPTEGQE